MNNLKAALKVIDEMENEAGGGMGTPEREYTIVFSSDLREVLTALCSEMEWRASRNAADKARDNALPRAEFQRLMLRGLVEIYQVVAQIEKLDPSVWDSVGQVIAKLERKDVWDAAIAASDKVMRWDQISKKKQQIRECASRSCGNCHYWMKSGCTPEKKHGQFKSIGSPGCSGFTLSQSSMRLSEEFARELAELEGKDV